MTKQQQAYIIRINSEFMQAESGPDFLWKIIPQKHLLRVKLSQDMTFVPNCPKGSMVSSLCHATNSEDGGTEGFGALEFQLQLLLPQI
jgi:hypothetical protein